MKEIQLISMFLFFLVKQSSSQYTGLPGASPLNGTTILGGRSAGSAADQLNYPNGVFVDAAGSIYVADIFNHRIQKRSPGAAATITVAGGNGFGNAADQLDQPYDVFVDPTGNIYVADYDNSRIQKWAPGATAGLTVAGGNGGGGAANQLLFPTSVFVDATGNIYVTDMGNHRIQKWVQGAVEGITIAGGNGFGGAANQLFYPTSAFVDASGNVYIADGSNNRIQKWSPGAAVGIAVAGGNGAGEAANQLSHPNDVFVDALGFIYIADKSNHRIQKWTEGALAGTTVAGGVLSPASTDLYAPSSCFLDAVGNMYISDDQNRVLKWAPGALDGVTVMGYPLNAPLSLFNIFVDASESVYVSDPVANTIKKWVAGSSVGIKVAGGNGSGPAKNQLNSPAGIFVDEAANIYIADEKNNRIQKWAAGASAGITVAGGHGKGSATNQLSSPKEVFVDSAGNIYIADMGNLRIVKWSSGASLGSIVAGPEISISDNVFFHKSGNIYVAQYKYYEVQKWVPGTSAPVKVAGGNGHGSRADQLEAMGNIFVDDNGNLFIADPFNYRVQKWAPGASSGITVAGGNGEGSAPNQLDRAWDVFVTTQGDLYVAETENNRRVQKFLLSTDYATTCPNLVFAAPSCSEKATISWPEARDSFPRTISIKNGINPGAANLVYKGLNNGHGYYESTDQYSWSAARDAASSVGAHLVTVGSAAENKFIENNINEKYNYAWIGMYNTGIAGSFAWVTGEPVNYTNWIPGEPNNYYNDTLNPQIFEPYVHINGWDSLSRWNDIGSNTNARFLAEFDKAVISYRQISGPANGSSQMAGTYQVCYERTDLRLNTSDTCCFSITITCNTSSSNISSTATLSNDNGKDLHILTSPNPSSNYFQLKIVSKNNPTPVNIKVLDMAGRIMETRNNVYPNQTVDIGRKLGAGVYFVQVNQGNKTVVEKIIRQ